MSQELFIINNLVLRVNPTDIQVFDQRFSDSVSAIRDVSTYSVSSNSAIATYVVTMAFDLDVASDQKLLVSLCTQLEKYPFVFIKSDRLSQFVPSVSRSITEYGMYAVKEWSIKHDYKAKNAIFVTIDMHYFNHIPYIKDFSFLTYEKSEKSNSRIKIDNKKKGVELRTVNSLAESEIFNDYFIHDTSIKQKKFDIGMDFLADDAGEVIFGRPQIYQATGEYAEAPYQIIKDNVALSGFEDDDVKAISYVNTFKSNKNNEENMALNYWIVYQDMPLFVVKDGLSKTFEVQSVTITKRNSIAANQLQMYMEPHIQYLGKNPASMTIELTVNNSEFEYDDMSDYNIKPYELLAQSLREAEQMHVVNGNKMPFKSLRIRSIANILAGANYFILDNETSFESADDQGRQGISINFIESDLTDMIGRSNLSLASTSLSEADMYPMIEIGAQLLEMYAKMEVLPRARPRSNLVSEKIIAEVEASQRLHKNINYNASLANNLKKIVDVPVEILNAISDLEGNIHEIVAAIYVEAQSFINGTIGSKIPKPATYRKGLIDTADRLRKISAYVKAGVDGDGRKLDLASYEFRRMFGAISVGIEQMLQGSVDAGLFKLNDKNAKDNDESQYIEIYRTIVKKGYDALSVKALGGKFNEIKGEAIPDMELYSSLVKGYADKNKAIATSDYLGETDARKFSPFFFINQDTYMDSTTLISLVDAVEEFSKDEFKINTLKTEGDKRIGEVEYIQEDNIPKYQTPEEAKKNRKTTKKQKDIKGRLERLAKYIDLTVERYDLYKSQIKNKSKVELKSLQRFEITKGLIRSILTIESGGDPEAVSPNGLFFGLFQLSKDALNSLYNGASSKWNDPVTNIDAAIKFWHTYVIPELTSENSRGLIINPNSPFNFYMVCQQGGRGYRAIITKFINPNTKNSLVSKSGYIFEGSNRHDYENMAQNYPGGRKKWNGTYNSWIEAWKEKFYSDTGIRVEIFWSLKYVATKANGGLDREALDLEGDGSRPYLLKVIAKIDKMYLGAQPLILDGDKISFPINSFVSTQLPSSSNIFNIFGLKTPTERYGSRYLQGTKYYPDALVLAESIFSKMKFPIYVYATVSGNKYTNNIIIDSNGNDYALEMIKNGTAIPEKPSDKTLIERYDLYQKVYQSAKTTNALNSNNEEPGISKSIGGGENVGMISVEASEQEILERFGNSFSALPEELSTLERSNELAKSNTNAEESELRSTDGLLTRPLKRSAPFIQKENIDLFNEELQKQFRCMRTGAHLSTGLDMAVPTVKVYIVEGLRDDWLGRYDIALPRETNLYEVSGLVEIKIQTADEMNPVAVASMSILNPGSIYTDVAAIARRGQPFLDTSGNNLEAFYKDKLGKLRLTTGTRIHIRMGYSNDPNDLETIFNGELTEVEGEDVLDIVAEGYGRELIALEQQEENVGYVESFFGNATTTSVIFELMQKDELYHFGKRTHVANSINPVATNILDGMTKGEADNAVGIVDTVVSNHKTFYGRVMDFFGDYMSLLGMKNTSTDTNGLVMGDWWRMSSELYTNVYSPEVQSIDTEFNGLYSFSRLASFYKSVTISFPIYQSTLWESLREVLYRHPGSTLSVMNYKERASLFYGIKEQLYIATDPPISMFTGSSEKRYTYNAEVEKVKYKMVKPASDFHLITSERDIVSNELSLSSGFKTKVDVRYFGTGFAGRPQADQFESNSGFGFFSAQLDDNLRATAIRSTTLYSKACDGESMAWRYGISELKRQAEMMYSGRIVIIGNPYMKAGDYAYLNDSFRGLTGIIKIRECSHIFTEKDGYLTVITPGLYVEPRVFMYSYLYTKLGLAMAIAANKIKTDAVTRFYDSRKIVYTSSILGVLSNKDTRDAYFGSQIQGIGLYVNTAIAVSGTALGAAGGAGAGLLGRFAGGAVFRTALGMLAGASSGLVGIIAFLARFALSTPVAVIGAGIAMLYLYQTIEKSNMTRQPLVLLPLLNNGIAYQSGLFGYEINTKYDSIFSEIDKTQEAAQKLLRAARSRLVSTNKNGSSLYESSRYAALSSYLKTVNGNASTDAFFERKENPNR